MNRIGMFAAGMAAALLAACTPRPAEEAAPVSAPAETEAKISPEAALAGASETSLPQEAALQETLSCVKDVPADSICTMDLNQCGHSGNCSCGPGYEYSPAMGKCLLVLDGASGAMSVAVADDACVKAPAGACTRDINACGQPSTCQCEEGFAWNDVAGKCLKGLG